MERENITKTMRVRQNFIYPDIKDTDISYGASISGVVLRENGDWRDALTPAEDQNVGGVESFACYIEAQQHAIAMMEEALFNEKDNNYASRFNALLSGGSESGGDPIKAARSIKYDGLISEEMMSWRGIDSWEEFHSWEGTDKDVCKNEGKKWLTKRSADFKIFVEKHYPIETKYLKIRESLKRSPTPISVCGWYERDGKYYKPQGLDDQHLTLAVYMNDKNEIYIRDTYPPYDKIVEANTDFDFAMGWIIRKKLSTPTLTLWQKLKYNVRNIFK